MSFKHDATSKLIEYWLASLNDMAPINISFLTEPVSKAVSSRVRSLEDVYSSFGIYRFLIRKGVYPTLLFTSASSGLGYGLVRAYNKQTKLALNLLGVLYPTYQCWKLIKSNRKDHNDQLESWLTYWLIYGSFQVLDHWIESDLFLFSRKKYNLYKLLILYWAQNPHSQGSTLLYRHVIQKPLKEQAVQSPKESSYQYLDGFQPPSLLQQQHVSNSSSDDDSIDSNHAMVHVSSNEKSFPPLLMSTSTEAAW
ncbi:TB2/DP1, HVA22 family-domain-containing protein [Gilbertella persicaria]|uniref:TB2/DP1, HVA22 family-domain-containing protein n=1 Tax=Gilbertella persicaria TaxID=101096 RepID=UPI0022208AC2|nr:TB2/DP1, HVA22 family-domain-containing protein [Gilbertella persicaria]KAI8075474.1 TB2/DP1, HVA22 family-domain-containing protein [Gilbertella persicaria]